MPGILKPAACPTLMGCTFEFIGGPVKPPLDAIFEIHKWFLKWRKLQTNFDQTNNLAACGMSANGATPECRWPTNRAKEGRVLV